MILSHFKGIGRESVNGNVDIFFLFLFESLGLQISCIILSFIFIPYEFLLLIWKQKGHGGIVEELHISMLLQPGFYKKSMAEFFYTPTLLCDFAYFNSAEYFYFTLMYNLLQRFQMYNQF